MLDLVPPAALLVLNAGVLAWLLRGDRLAALPHAPTAVVCAAAPAIYGLGALLFLLTGNEWLLVVSTLGTLAIPAGLLLLLEPTRGGAAGVVGLAAAAWLVCRVPREVLSLRGWDVAEVAVGAYLAVALGLVVAGLARGRVRAGLERRILFVGALPTFPIGLAYVLFKSRVTHVPLVSTSLLIGGELALLLLVREGERRLRAGRESNALTWVAQVVLLGTGALLLLSLAMNVGLFPKSPAPLLVAVGVTTVVSVGYGLLRPRLERALSRAFYPEAHQARERLRELQGELAETRERLRRAEHLSVVGQLAAKVAHEIKNPLGPIKGYARIIERELAQEGVDSEVVRRGLDVIRQEVEEIDARARGLLELARPPDPTLQPVDVAGAAQDVLDLTRADAPEGVALAWRERPAEAPARTDPLLFRSALTNVVHNAVAALGDGPGRVELELRREPDGWVLHVDDDGPGLPDGDPEALFRPFVSHRPDGHGLGLLIARGAMRALGGDLLLERREPAGARAVLRLPTAGEPPAAEVTPARPSAAGEPAPTPLG